MLSDHVHQKIMEVLSETNITLKLADFQLVSLHVLGNQQNLVLVSPTGSGKMLGIVQYTFFKYQKLKILHNLQIY
jgi:Lhr-like helicase